MCLYVLFSGGGKRALWFHPGPACSGSLFGVPALDLVYISEVWVLPVCHVLESCLIQVGPLFALFEHTAVASLVLPAQQHPESEHNDQLSQVAEDHAVDTQWVLWGLVSLEEERPCNISW